MKAELNDEKLALLREIFDDAFNEAWDEGKPNEAYPRGLTAVYRFAQKEATK